MTKVIAIREIYYDQKSYFPGDEFEMEDRYAKILPYVPDARVRLADDQSKAEPQHPPPLKYETKVVTPQPVASPMTTDSLTKPKRQYKRRDLTAEQ